MLSTALTVLMAAAPQVETQTIPLEVRTPRTWKLELPSDAFRTLEGSIPVAHSAGKGFLVEARGEGLAFDTDGDGQVDRTVEGSVDEVTKAREANVVLRATAADGSPLTYGVRLLNQGEGWTWAAGGIATGRLGDLKIQVVDLDGDGRYDGVGTDAMSLGTSGSASHLSSVVSVAGVLHTAEVAPDGSALTLSPFEGDSGTLDLKADLDSKGKLLRALVKSTDGRYAFDLAASNGTLRIPTGTYLVHGGRIGLGKSTVDVEARTLAPLEVTSDATTALEWGGPVRAEFEYDRQGTEVTFYPDRVWYYGNAGERYLGWNPIGKSPEFTVKETKLGTELLKAVFPGSC